MMEMEMNAALDGDDASESNATVSEGSSVSDTFCSLERDYEKIMSEMKTNEALAPFEAEYTRLFESLYKAYRKEKELSSECDTYKQDILDKTKFIRELRKTIGDNENEITELKERIVKLKKRADAAHTREQNAQEMIENLRLNITKLGLEIEQKNKQLAAEKDVTISKQKESLMKERERLLGEMDTMRQRIKNMTDYAEDLERKNNESEEQIKKMHDILEMQMKEISHEKSGRERAETEAHHFHEEIIVRKNELEIARATIESNMSAIAKLESTMKQLKAEGEKMQKEIARLTQKKLNLQTDVELASAEMEKLEKQLTEKDKQQRNMRRELNRSRDETAKCKHEKDVVEKQLLRMETERGRLDRDLKQAMIDVRNAEYDMFTCRREQLDFKQRIEGLLREKNMLARSKENIQERMKRINHELMLCHQSRKKVELELDELMRSIEDVKSQLEAVTKEKNKFSNIIVGLEKQIEGHVNEAILKQAEISDYKKCLAESEVKYRQQQSLLEMVRAERNLYSKNLVEAQEEIQDLKNKVKLMSQQIEQLKEDIANKEADLIKQEFLLGRAEKEKENLKVELRTSHMTITSLRREIDEGKREEKRLRQEIRQADMDISRRQKIIDNIMNERDILGTQLVRRNDELSLQYSRIKVLNTTLHCGEAQYNERLEDIRLLKFEVKRLRTEKALLIKRIDNDSDLRQEVFHLNRDLAKERLKVTALEEEVQTPLNIHRWRKLEGTDPAAYDLVKKVQMLHKRLLKMSAEMMNKDKKIQNVEKLYANLREVLAKQPHPDVVENLYKVQNALRKRGDKLKCLVAELNMYEVQTDEYKGDMTKMTSEMFELKRKYYTQKRTLERMREAPPKSTYEQPILPDISLPDEKFYGGGFRITTSPMSRNCRVLETSG